MAEARETLEVEGTVREILPNALYRVELATEARPSVTAHLGGGTGPARRWSSCPARPRIDRGRLPSTGSILASAAQLYRSYRSVPFRREEGTIAND